MAVNETGTTFGFEQRDIYFDSAQPLHVELSPPAGQEYD